MANFFRDGMSQYNKSFDFGADPKNRPDQELLTKFYHCGIDTE